MTDRPLRVLVAPDKFAGTLTAAEATEAIASGWRSSRPSDVVDRCPMADGGPGFLDVVAGATSGSVQEVPVTGPDGQPVRGRVVVVASPRGRTVYVEAADACGLHLAPTPREPLAMSTAGVADLLDQALRLRPDRVIVGVGGTASTDGGAGLVQRWRAGADDWPSTVELVAAVDAVVPLLGRMGSARGFAAQKGASSAQVDQLEQRLADWAATSGGDPDAPGAGAGGGLGFGLALLGARLCSGGAVVADLVGLPARAAASDVVVTGEGRLDATSFTGKVVGVVARADPRPPTLALVGVDARRADDVGPALSVASLDARFGSVAARQDAAGRLTDLAAQTARGLPGSVFPG